MPKSRHVELFHAPQSRSRAARILLEELGADFSLRLVDLPGGEQRTPAFLRVNPMGKVPALLHDGVLVTEQAAIFMYLAELYPEAGLAPAVGDPLRGSYLRWMVFYGSCFEPAIVDRAMQRGDAPLAMSPYGTFDQVLATLTAQLAQGPWMLGESFSALDVLWAAAFEWTIGFKLVPPSPLLQDYIDRFAARPAVQRARDADAALVATKG